VAVRFCDAGGAMKEFLYLIGQPGAGKTTLLRKALEGCNPHNIVKPFAHRLYHQNGVAPTEEIGVQLGHDRFPFGGTDTLSMAVQPRVVEWLRETQYTHLVAEGDRLGNEKFFRSVRDLGFTLTVGWLSTPDRVAAERRAYRAGVCGTAAQNPAWLKGRVNKVLKLAHAWATPEWCLDGNSTAEELAVRLRAHPVIAHIRHHSL
jgi:energy-coupling factor transporter ATP-binding protein EcfA2